MTSCILRHGKQECFLFCLVLLKQQSRAQALAPPPHNDLVTQVQKLVSPAYIPGGSNEIAGFVIIMLLLRSEKMVMFDFLGKLYNSRSDEYFFNFYVP